MAISDQYLTILAPSTGLFKDRGSKFLAYAYPVRSEEQCQEYINALKKEHSKARHWCYAYRLGMDKNRYRANDDGEPGGTAGRPILGQIDSFGLTNVLVVVVRYFGGTKLGTTGLIQAYKASTEDALQQSEIVERLVKDVYLLTFEYALMSATMNAIKKSGGEILNQEFEANGKVKIAFPKSEVQQQLIFLKAEVGGLRIEEVKEETVVPGFEIEFIETV